MMLRVPSPASGIIRWPKFKLFLSGSLIALAAAACSGTVPVPTATPAGASELEPLSTPGSASVRRPTPTPAPALVSIDGPTTAPAPAVREIPASGDDYEPISSIFKELNPTGPKEFNGRFFEELLEPDAITPVYHEYIVLADPEEAELEPNDLVMGVTIGGESRAYPVRVLRFREMVNDVLGGVPILVTW